VGARLFRRPFRDRIGRGSCSHGTEGSRRGEWFTSKPKMNEERSSQCSPWDSQQRSAAQQTAPPAQLQPDRTPLGAPGRRAVRGAWPNRRRPAAAALGFLRLPKNHGPPAPPFCLAGFSTASLFFIDFSLMSSEQPTASQAASALANAIPHPLKSDLRAAISCC
jgi:hypothetical protein